MEAEDDMIVLVVVDDDDESRKTNDTEPSASGACMEVNDIIKTAQKHGQFIEVKSEPLDDYPCDYLEDDNISSSEKEIKAEPKYEQYEDDDDYIPDDEEYLQTDDLATSKGPDKHRFSMLKPWQQRSFVAELRQEYKELRDDEELLINTLERIMRMVKAPLPPKDFYIMNGIMFECVICRVLLDTIPAAGRHYQEKHGQRYLVCYACGVDFRSTTNLYKHEKRCIAPDASVVLKARAAFLGRKGRSRPYLTRNKFYRNNNKQTKFPCQLCSAVFITKSNLESHENLHRGERPYRCHACPCAYTSYSALSRHAKKHTDVQFICDHCSRSFKIKAALVAHMDTHKPMRKYGCDECSRRFAQKSALMLHVNRVHRNLPPPCGCQICPKRYPRMSLLKAHMKRAHGMSIITRKMFFKSLPTMTELEVKQSKIILKYDDDLLEYPHPMKTEPKTEEYKQEYEEHYAESDKEMNNDDNEESHEITVSELMQYVTKGDQEIGSNVVYIQNGEIVQMEGECVPQENMILEVEALADGHIFVQTKNART